MRICRFNFKGQSENIDMARPTKTGLDYFSHDVDVTTDPKIEPAILLYGAAAYAFYFMHLEYCYRSDDLSIDISDKTESGAEMREVIQRKLQTDAETYEKILQTFLRHGAFDAEYYASTGKLTNNGIKKRAENVLKKRKNETERTHVKCENFNDIASNEQVSAAETQGFRQVSAAETHPETGESKVKESKVKDKGQVHLPGAGKPTPAGNTEKAPVKGSKDKATENPEKAAPVVVGIPLNDGSEHPVTEPMRDEWQVLYPAVDVTQELRAMVGWCKANPNHKKTARGVNRFINGWLARAQNRARASPSPDDGPKPGGGTLIGYR
jgi:hypothetical protein